MKWQPMSAAFAAVFASIWVLSPSVASADDACGGVIVGGSLEVTREGATCPWAFGVDSITVKCAQAEGAARVWLTSDRGAFALNGAASTIFPRLPGVGEDDERPPMWLDNEVMRASLVAAGFADAAPPKISLAPWIRAGLTLCGPE